jgi:hypothetical protein
MRALVACAVLLVAAPAAARDAIPRNVSQQELVGYLKDGGEDARKEACKRLRERSDPTVIPAIGQAMRKDLSPRVRLECLESLKRMGANAAAAPFVREAALEDGDKKVREEALDALKEVDPQHGGDVAGKALLLDREYDVRKEACRVVERRGWQAAVPAMAKVVTDASERPELRRACLQALIATRSDAAYAVVHKVLVEADDEDVRREAVELIEHEPRASSLPALCAALKDKSDRIAGDAAKGLRTLGKKDGATCLRAAAREVRNDHLAGEMNKIASELER